MIPPNTLAIIIIYFELFNLHYSFCINSRNVLCNYPPLRYCVGKCSGEKTHTNKLGAQLIAKVAAKFLLETALKNYVDASTLELPATDDIDIIIDDFKSESVVTKKTIWTFSDYKAGDAIANEEAGKQVVEINGLYARGSTERAINAVASPVSKVTFSDGTESQRRMGSHRPPLRTEIPLRDNWRHLSGGKYHL